MWYLYVLQSVNSNRNYIGISEDPLKRLSKHNNGSVRSTKAYRPWEVSYKEQFKTKKDARIRELDLKKSGYKRLVLFKKIKRALSSIG